MIKTTISSGNPIVDAVGKLNITGNIIPEAWYSTVKNSKGKTSPLAILILADIVYWYRPTEIRDESTQEVKFTKKFHDRDYLQRSYNQITEKFGISSKQARDALIVLEQLNVIKRHFRTITTKSGLKLSNVMFLELFPDALKKLTFPNTDAINKNVNTSLSDCEDLLTNQSDAIYQNDDTYTENTTYNTTDITPSSNNAFGNEEDVSSYDEIIAHNINIDSLKTKYPNELERINMLYSIMCEVANSKAASIRINKENMPHNKVLNMYLKITDVEIEYILDVLNAPKDIPINNLSNYIKTLLYNSANLAGEYIKQKSTIGSCKENKVEYNNPFNDFTQRKYTAEEFAELERKLLTC